MSHNAAVKRETGSCTAIDAMLAKLRDALNLELVEGLPEQVDGFNPNGWMLFRVWADPSAIGPSEYVAVRRETGQVFF
jgi:hypothetical protein